MKNKEQVSDLMISLIDFNAGNPRKKINEAELQELAQSIAEVGVIHPITVRLKGERYELVVGERRVRASTLAGFETIPGLIRDLTDQQARELMISENLQRRDILPTEEATAYIELRDLGYQVAELALRFGKSEAYIRSRLLLENLDLQFCELLVGEVINVGTAIELARYDQTIQQEIYIKHFEDPENRLSWRPFTTARIRTMIEEAYTTRLDDYAFDKTDCDGCPFNSSCTSLFGNDEQAKCSNRTCLNTKNSQHIVERATAILTSENAVLRSHYSSDSGAVERLAAMGYEIGDRGIRRSAPQAPKKPQEEGIKKSEYKKLMKEYEQYYSDYEKALASFNADVESGKLVKMVVIDTKGITVEYTKVTQDTQEAPSIEKQLADLKLKDRRNKEICHEKTVAELKEIIHKADVENGEITELEERLLYFIMIASLKSKHRTLLNLKEGHYLSESDRRNVVYDLTKEQKKIVLRDYLIDYFAGSSFSDLLLELSKQFMPDELAAIQEKHGQTYKNRQAKLRERAAILKADKMEIAEI